MSYEFEDSGEKTPYVNVFCDSCGMQEEEKLFKPDNEEICICARCAKKRLIAFGKQIEEDEDLEDFFEVINVKDIVDEALDSLENERMYYEEDVPYDTWADKNL